MVKPAAIERGPRDDDELWLYVKAIWGIEIPRKQVCPTHVSPFKAFSDAYFARDEMAIWKASRGLGGKSFLLAVLALTEMVALKATTTILGGSGQQSKRVHEAMTQAWNSDYAPVSLLAKEPTMYETILTNQAKTTALMASQASARGPHPQRLRLDEIDEMRIDILDAALGQPMSKPGIPSQVVMSSTHQYPDGTMHEMMQRATESGWPIHEWCFRETQEPHGWLSHDEIERTKRRVTALMWHIEYEGQEPSGGERAIMPEAVEAMFDKSLGEYEGGNGEYIEVEPPVQGPLHDGTYATGTDWAKEKDWTIIVTFRIDDHPWRLVAWERLGRMSWPSMVASLDERVRRYPGASEHDNTGLGDVIDDYLREDSKGIQMVGNTRKEMFSEYISAIEGGSIISPYIKFAYDEHRYVTHGDLTGAGHPPDSFVAGALAWHARHAATGSWGFV